MSNIGWLIIALAFLSAFLLIKNISLKKQIKNLTKQIESFCNGFSEKMLDISLVDKDLENLAGVLNRSYNRQRYSVARILKHEEHLKEGIANISHDLRTPLTVITGHLQLLLNSSLSEEQNRRAKAALHKANRMAELIEAFYELSILDTNQAEPQKEKINFSNLLIDFLAENAPLFESRQIQPEIELPDSSVFIQTDHPMLERILQNLLTNAVRYSTGKIIIRLTVSADRDIVLYVENTVEMGTDFDVERLFERFYTGDKARHSDSTGLGLAVVKLLTEKLGGEISAEIKSNMMSIKLQLKG